MSPADAAPSPVPIATVDAMGVDIHLSATSTLSGPLLSRVRDAWSDCHVSRGDAGRQRRTLNLSPDAFVDIERGLSDLSTRVTLEALDALRGTRLLLHAAGVATDDGRTIALVGPSGRGKTTASRHVGTHFAYVSDETVAVADDLTVEPYRKPLSVITPGHAHKEQIAPSIFGLKGLPDTRLRLSAITLIDRQPDAAAIGPQAIDTIDAICEMTPQISYLPELPTPLQYLARLFDAIGAPTRLIYRDAVELPALVRTMLDEPGRPAAAWTVPLRAETPGPWRVAPYDDAIVVAGRACVMRNGMVTALDQRGCLVWTQCLAGASAEAIVATAVAEFGEPEQGEATALIAATIEELRVLGFIEAA